MAQSQKWREKKKERERERQRQGKKKKKKEKRKKNIIYCLTCRYMEQYYFTLNTYVYIHICMVVVTDTTM